MEKNIFKTVENILRMEPKYVSEDGKILKAVVYTDIMMMNQQLLSLLLANDKTKMTFFKDINGTLVLS